MQKILTLIITGAILYMIFQQNAEKIKTPDKPNRQPTQTERGQEATPETQASGTFFEKTLSSVMINVLKSDEGRIFMESLLQPMNKTVSGSGSGFMMNNDNFIQSIFKINSFGEGEKGPASCGHIVTVHYKILNNQNVVLDEKVTTFPLGSEKIAPGLDAVIVGMRTGETRHATISSKYFQETAQDKLSSFKVNVLLKEIIPQNFIDDDVKIFDDEIAYRIPLMCGNKAIYDAKITKLSNNEVIYNSEDSGKRISMKIGNLSYPMIFSHALHNKIPVGTRTVISKGKFFKSYASENSTIFPNKELPEDEYFMVEFYNFHDNILTKPGTFPSRQGVPSKGGEIKITPPSNNNVSK
jgi:FKBP-type peptidyl-prolyl cis-trans isomerase